MNASTAYFFGGGSVKYTKIRCGSVSLVFSSSGRAERSAYFLADVGSILCGGSEIRGHAEQGLSLSTEKKDEELPPLFFCHLRHELQF